MTKMTELDKWLATIAALLAGIDIALLYILFRG